MYHHRWQLTWGKPVQMGGCCLGACRDRGFEPVGPSRADEEDRWSRKFAPAASRSPPRAQHVSDTADRYCPSSTCYPLDLQLAAHGIELLYDAADPLAAVPPIHIDLLSPLRCTCYSDAEDPLSEDSACFFRWMRSGPAPSQASTAEQPAFERKRLQLKPRSLPAPELPTPPEPKPDELKTERQPQAAPAAPKPRSNPFGQARPREEVLKEKGVSESGSDRVDRWGMSCKEPLP